MHNVHVGGQSLSKNKVITLDSFKFSIPWLKKFPVLEEYMVSYLRKSLLRYVTLPSPHGHLSQGGVREVMCEIHTISTLTVWQWKSNEWHGHLSDSKKVVLQTWTAGGLVTTIPANRWDNGTIDALTFGNTQNNLTIGII